MSNGAEVGSQIDYMRKRYDSLAERVQGLEKENDVLKGMISTHAEEKRQMDAEKIKQDMIIAQHLGTGDGAMKKLEEEIIRLRGLLKANGIKAD